MWILWLTAALAAPAGFAHVGDGAGCRLYRGPSDGGVAPARAECHWPEVDPRVLGALLARFERYDELIPPVTRSTVVRVVGDRALVHQVARTRGIAPREVLLWMERAASDGASRVRWTTAAELPLELPPRHVRAPRNEGWWEIAAHPQGGARVVHQVTYDPGGSVPGWVVRWAQVGGLREVMTHVRALAGR